MQTTLNELKETAWDLTTILSWRDEAAALRYDEMLRDMEDAYVEQSAWEQIVAELRSKTNG